MPIHEYDCWKCKISFAVFHTAKASVVKCPNCESDNVKKKISACSSFSPVCGVKKPGGSGRG